MRAPLKEQASSVATSYTFADENAGPMSLMAGGSSFSALTQAFNARIAQLQQLTCLRVEDSAKGLFTQDLKGLEACVAALEKMIQELKVALQSELAVMPKARAVLEALRLQQEHLMQIAANLPQRLPSLGGATGAASTSGQAATAAIAATGTGGGPAAHGKATVPGKDQAAGASAAGPSHGHGSKDATREPPRKPRETAPRWYITQAELASLSSYMRNRLTLDKVNAAIDELASHADVNTRWMAAVRANAMARIPADERKRAMEMYHAIAGKEGVKGRFWFPEQDLKGGTALRLDKSGRGLLMALRHLGRISEVRVSSDALGGGMAVYVLQVPT